MGPTGRPEGHPPQAESGQPVAQLVNSARRRQLSLLHRMIGLIPFTFRFRGKIRRLFDMYRCFLAHPGKGLHPTQISRYTGIGFAVVLRLLDGTPELFVRLPKRDGLTRYRLTSAMTARQPEEVERFLTGQARRESLILYALGAMVLCALLIVVILIGPAL